MPATQASKSRTSEVAIFGRVLANGQGEMSRELASYILTLGFAEEDQARMKDLAGRNQDGSLTVDATLRVANGLFAGDDIACFPLRGHGTPIRVEH